MEVIQRVSDVRSARGRWGRVGLVPTMGYLHDGHLSLILAARSANETVVMSLFVNPSQFGPHEDFASYPRDTPRDLRLAAQAGVDVVFMPPREEVYPDDFDTWVEVGELGRRWEGERRPGHFRGVATVVLKLFTIVQPEFAYFGEKDYQQLMVVRRMVTDLNLPLEIVPCPTVREPSGLALSSRNGYVQGDGRSRASVLSRALRHAESLVKDGTTDVSRLIGAMNDILATEPAAQVDYLAIVDSTTLEPLARVEERARILAAMHFEGVRLIDNLELRPG